MRGQVGRRTQFAFNYLTVELGNDHVLRRQFIIGNAARLDRDQSFISVDAAGIAEGIEDEAAPNEFEVRFQHFFAQRLQQHGDG